MEATRLHSLIYSNLETIRQLIVGEHDTIRRLTDDEEIIGGWRRSVAEILDADRRCSPQHPV